MSGSIAQNLPFNPFQREVVSSRANQRDGTMATVNDVAVRTARASSQPTSPSGSVLSLVTWNQRVDEHWFGREYSGRHFSIKAERYSAHS